LETASSFSGAISEGESAILIRNSDIVFRVKIMPDFAGLSTLNGMGVLSVVRGTARGRTWHARGEADEAITATVLSLLAGHRRTIFAGTRSDDDYGQLHGIEVHGERRRHVDAGP
jgi:hypothetical protein